MDMDAKKYEDLILNSIDQLRKRKARPDLEHISSFLKRRHGIQPSVVQEQIEDLVRRDIVSKVNYKGSDSYRNVAKWTKTKSVRVGKQLNSDPSDVVREAMTVLSSRTVYISLEEIEAYLVETKCENISSETLSTILAKAVADGWIAKLPNGKYTKKTENPTDLVNTSIQNIESGKKGVTVQRPASTRKRFKKTHGPDFVDSGSILLAESFDHIRCDYCLLTSQVNINGEQEIILVCKDCNYKAHPSCMDYTVKLSGSSQISTWQCADCKICFLCKNSGDGDLLVCDHCDIGYHMDCHVPPVLSKPLQKWVCSDCAEELECNEKKKVKQLSPKSVPNCSDSNLSDVMKEEPEEDSLILFFKECLKEYPEVIPHANNWSIDDVEAFFKSIGYIDEASVFREQEIDGQSLMLMKRNDVLTGLALKLGSALKIYTHIERLQSKVLNL